ncbi:sensor histidine kinase [Actinotalea subterranea]|uniref:sensor histidine kinase n=1 Tax=Actinotalea subterranea TaxID=2607497 RepID=UPI0011ED1D53|nr:histidine kinase [Actinotalea subterranea]
MSGVRLSEADEAPPGPPERRGLRAVGDGVASLALAVLAMLPRPGVGVPGAILVLALGVGWGRRGLLRGALVGAAMLAIHVGMPLAATVTGHEAPTGELPFALMRAGVPWLVAVAWYQRRQIQRDARDLAAQSRLRDEVVADNERATERLVLAEGLHDDLGHALSLVALNLGALEVRRDLAPDVHARITRAREELAAAVERLGASVAALRAGADDRASTPDGALPARDRQPPALDPAEVVARARRSGMRVRVTGHEGAAPGRGLDGELLPRVLQEALTNAAKHAPGADVRVELVEAADALHVVVRNPTPRDGERTGAPGRAGGTGLAALGWSLRVAGGQLSWHTTAGEFVLAARVPVNGRERVAASCLEASRETPAAFAIATAAHRKGALVLAGAALVIVVALAVVELSTKGPW